MPADPKAFSSDRTPDQDSGRSVGSALITGASSGIGEATARAFAQAGFDLLLVARSKAKLSALAQELTALALKVEIAVIDLADCEQVKRQMKAAIARFGPIDILVNSAGIGYTGPIGEMPLADWQRLMALNVTSVFQVVQAVLPEMRNRSKGLVINIASIAARSRLFLTGELMASARQLWQDCQRRSRLKNPPTVSEWSPYSQALSIHLFGTPILSRPTLTALPCSQPRPLLRLSCISRYCLLTRLFLI